MNSIDKNQIHQFFGREFSDDELEFYGARLTRQMQALERLRAWEPELGSIEPATVTRMLRASEE